ncbi:MAG: hypothetical protein CME65_15035 [Halobacteriovoraceae bacterium]|nr:hypothetical protein [Halobacteriovoraceae bacterium]|tara:strand:+ start:8378 stop:10795 length:2418 start_codon:yes stop_codon:yes gene_type:complete
MEIRKVKIPINLKLTFAVLLLTAMTLGGYIWLAVDLIKNDKIAYVFEAVETQNQQSAKVLESRLKQLSTFHKIFRQVGYHNAAVAQIFQQNTDILAYVEKVQKGSYKRILNPMSELDTSLNISWDELTPNKYQLINLADELYLVESLVSNEKSSYLIIPAHALTELLPSSQIYQYDIAVDNKLLASSKINLEKPAQSYGIQTKVLGNNIISFRPYLNNIVFLTQINYSSAIEAATALTNKSIYFGILVAGFIILSVLFLSHRITTPIKKLYLASQELSKANFSYRVKLSEADEVGVLGDSFNYMASEIQRYLKEMKEKSRMENELKTAQLVQQSFFPSNFIQGHNFKLEAYYQPAAECSGDWWGHLSTKDSEIFIILDVTGHGTAAALVTAMMHNTLTGINELGRENPSFRREPSTIMEFLNKSLCSININLNATAFIIVFDGDEMRYSNASHNPPLLFRPKESGDLGKQDIQPLNENIGSRLGENINSFYASTVLNWRSGDQIVLFTDGIIEAPNSAGKAYGNRRFLKNILSQFNRTQSISPNDVVDDFKTFLDGTDADDDITVLSIQLHDLKIFQTFDEKLEVNHLYERVDDSKFATVIVYDELISKTLSAIEMGEQLQAIVNRKEVETRKSPLRPKEVQLKDRSQLHFMHQSIKELSEEIDSALVTVVQNDSFSEIARYLKQTAIELVQNALIYQRAHNIAKPVELILGRDENYYIVEVTDLNGALDPLVILNKAKRAFTERTYEKKDTGAGLGSSMVILGSDEVAIKVKKDEYTQIRCIISKYKRLKEFKLKNNAIYISKG